MVRSGYPQSRSGKYLGLPQRYAGQSEAQSKRIMEESHSSSSKNDNPEEPPQWCCQVVAKLPIQQIYRAETTVIGSRSCRFRQEVSGFTVELHASTLGVHLYLSMVA